MLRPLWKGVDGMSEDRPRKSWRDIDKAKDGSSHRQGERPKGGRKGGARSQKSYRASLDRLFESGKVAELVQEADEKSGDADSTNRFALMRAITQAEDPVSIGKAIDAYLKEFELPEDADVLSKVLEHKDPDLQLDAMEMLQRLVEQGEEPRRVRTVVGRLKYIRDTADFPKMERIAQSLIDSFD
jgi:hypothetical protein